MPHDTLKRARAAFGLAVCVVCAGCRVADAAHEPVERRDRVAGHEFVERHMGCTARIVIVADDAETARAAARAAFEVIAQCDAELSDYRTDNAVAELARRAGRGEFVAAGEILLAALDRAEPIKAATEGAFDVTIGPLARLWRDARRAHVLPHAAAIEHARALCRGAIERDGVRLRLPRAGMALDFGGIGKGFAADRALACLRARGFDCALVGIEGDLALGVAPPGTHGWRVRATSGADGDDETLALAECGVSTSGDTEQFALVDGRRLSHVVDPRSGWPLEHSARVTVIARDATAADALATAFSVLGGQRALEIAALMDGVEAHMTERAGAGFATAATPGYARFVVPAELDAAADAR